MINLITGNTTKDISAFLPVLDRFFFGLSGVYDIKFISVAFYILFIIIFFVILRKFKLTDFQSKLFKGLLFTWVAVPVFFAFYGHRPSEYYFDYLVPIVLLTLSFLISKLKPWMLIIVTLILMSFWVKRSYEYTTTNSLSIFYKDKAVQFLSMITKNENLPFNVSFDVPLDEDAGFRYFLDFYKVKYTGSPKDPLIEFVIPPSRKKTSYPFGGIGVYIPEGLFQK
jgi:hypothetical protein